MESAGLAVSVEAGVGSRREVCVVVQQCVWAGGSACIGNGGRPPWRKTMAEAMQPHTVETAARKGADKAGGGFLLS